MADKKVTKDDLFWTFVRSNFLLGSFNFERMQSMGFCVSMMPILKRVYADNPEELKAALKRHLEFFNTQPFVAAAIMGIIGAMEEKRANGADISPATLSGVKVGLIGPLAGVGDPIFWGTIRPVLAALGAGIALTGSIIGPIIFFVGFNAIRLATHWYGVKYGGASVLGLLVMGALVAKWTTVNMPLVISEYDNSAGEHVVTTLQTILDSLMPGIVALLMTFACMWLLKRGMNPLVIIIGLFAIGIVGYAIGLFA